MLNILKCCDPTAWVLDCSTMRKINTIFLGSVRVYKAYTTTVNWICGLLMHLNGIAKN